MTSPITHVSDTARWVALYRAMESERRDPLFRDPYARRLAGEQGEAILRGMKQGRRWAWPMIVRTAVMDELILRAITRDGVDTVLNLAAQRAFRWWLIDIASPLLLQWMQRTWGKTATAGNAAFIFAPAEDTKFFAPYGWREVEYRNTMDEGIRLKRVPKMMFLWRILGLFASRARKEQFKRFSGIVLLERREGA